MIAVQRRMHLQRLSSVPVKTTLAWVNPEIERARTRMRMANQMAGRLWRSFKAMAEELGIEPTITYRHVQRYAFQKMWQTYPRGM